LKWLKPSSFFSFVLCVYTFLWYLILEDIKLIRKLLFLPHICLDNWGVGTSEGWFNGYLILSAFQLTWYSIQFLELPLSCDGARAVVLCTRLESWPRMWFQSILFWFRSAYSYHTSRPYLRWNSAVFIPACPSLPEDSNDSDSLIARESSAVWCHACTAYWWISLDPE
jgi:hypothetical protein